MKPEEKYQKIIDMIVRLYPEHEKVDKNKEFMKVVHSVAHTLVYENEPSSLITTHMKLEDRSKLYKMLFKFDPTPDGAKVITWKILPLTTEAFESMEKGLEELNKKHPDLRFEKRHIIGEPHEFRTKRLHQGLKALE